MAAAAILKNHKIRDISATVSNLTLGFTDLYEIWHASAKWVC